MRRRSVSGWGGLVSLLLVLLLAAVLSVAADRVVRDQAVSEGARSAALVAGLVTASLTPSALERPALTDDEVRALDALGSEAQGLRRLRVWGGDGRLLHDSSGGPLGVLPRGPLLATAYDGQVAQELVEGAVPSLHVLVPVPGRGAVPRGVVGLELDHSASAARAGAAAATLTVLLSLGLLVVWAVLGQVCRVVKRTLRQAARDSEAQARTDQLTGLPDRRGLLEAVDAAQAEGRPCALVALDLDRFRDVNETLGHEVGDRLLVEVGARLTSEVRGDTLVARVGGDDFAVLLPGVSDPAAATAVADRLARALSRPFELQGLSLVVHPRAGIALAPQHAGSAAHLLQRADVARTGAGVLGVSSAVYDPDRDHGSTDRLLLLGDLEKALARGELSLAYQPCYDLQVSGACLAVEALVRWHSPTRGFVSPAEFVPVCERSGLVRELTAFVLGEALRQVRAWEDAGTVVNVAVNLSASNLAEESLPAQVAQLLTEHRVGADRLVLEITESAVIPDPQRAERVLDALVRLGVDIAIDDFGTGYSSMSRLLALPLTALKVDRSFVADLPHGPGAAVVVATTRLAHDLGLFVVAEGVETELQLRELQRLGCDVGQGYHLSRPLPPHEVPAAVARRVATSAPLAV